MKRAPSTHAFGLPEAPMHRAMPLLEAAHERTANDVTADVVDYLRSGVVVRAEPLMFSTYAEFVDSLEQPTHLQVMDVQPFQALAAWALAPELVARIVDRLFGGDGSLPTAGAGRGGGVIERRVVGRMVAMFAEHYARAWKDLHAITMTPARHELDARLAMLAGPRETVLRGQFTLSFADGSSGDVELCLPWAPLRPAWTAMAGQLSSKRMSDSPDWSRRLRREMQAAPIELVATLAQQPINLGDTLNFNVGDLIPIELGDAVTVQADGRLVLKGSYGVSRGRYAVKVTESMATKEEWPDADAVRRAASNDAQES